MALYNHSRDTIRYAKSYRLCSGVLLTTAVGFLPSADLIVSLTRDGTISQKGTFSQLQHAEGYVKSLLVSRQESTSDEDIHDDEEDVPPRTDAKPAAVAAKQDDKRRQLGDSTIYRYYFSNIGIWFVIGLLGLEVGWAFLESFPSTSPHALQLHD